jgi:DNA-binding transcriptional LysR family regulator
LSALAAQSQGMDLSRFDLNLLLVFEAVLRERSVTRAGERLSLSQPAMSHALNRLRYLLKDQLFVRGPNGMEPTPRAEELSTAVGRILDDLRRALEPVAFDPATSDRAFRIAVNNYAAMVVAPLLVFASRPQAPGVRLLIRPSGVLDMAELLERGELDLAITAREAPNGRFGSTPLVEDAYVAVMRNDHPAAETDLTLASFAALPRLNVSSSGEDMSFVTEALERAGLSQAAALDAPYLSTGQILAGSDMIAVLGRRFADAAQHQFPLAILELPFPSPKLRSIMMWSRRMDAESAHNWVRTLALKATIG